MNSALPTDPHIASEILRLLSLRAPAASLCPSDAARSLCADEARWRALMPRVRSVARDLARKGVVQVTQRDATLDPDDAWDGPIRLRRGPRFPG